MKRLEVYCERALEMGMDGAKVIEPCSIITAEWVRMKCQFGCPMFGRRLTCPPHAPTPNVTRGVIDSYQKAILLHRKFGNRHGAKGLDQNIFRLEFNKTIVRLEIGIFLDGYYKAWSMGSGYCRLCKECNRQVFVNMGLRQDRLWRRAALMSLEQQGTTDFILRW